MAPGMGLTERFQYKLPQLYLLPNKSGEESYRWLLRGLSHPSILSTTHTHTHTQLPPTGCGQNRNHETVRAHPAVKSFDAEVVPLASASSFLHVLGSWSYALSSIQSRLSVAVGPDRFPCQKRSWHTRPSPAPGTADKISDTEN